MFKEVPSRKLQRTNTAITWLNGKPCHGESQMKTLKNYLGSAAINEEWLTNLNLKNVAVTEQVFLNYRHNGQRL